MLDIQHCLWRERGISFTYVTLSVQALLTSTAHTGQLFLYYNQIWIKPNAEEVITVTASLTKTCYITEEGFQKFFSEL